MKNKTSYDHLDRCRKSTWQNSTFIVKTLNEVGIEETYPNIKKATYDNAQLT